MLRKKSLMSEFYEGLAWGLGVGMLSMTTLFTWATWLDGKHVKV